MGSGEYNNLKYYMQNTETGEVHEMGEPKEINTTFDDEYTPEKMHRVTRCCFRGSNCDEFTINVVQGDLIRLKRKLFPESLNNYRKLHGMPLIRKRWHG